MADLVKSVEFVELSTTSTSTSQVLTKGQDYTNCVPFFSCRDTSDYQNNQLWDCYFSSITGSGVVNFDRAGSGGTNATISCFVVEFDPNEVYVEQGSFDMESSTDDNVTTSSGFDPDHTFMMHYWKSSSASYVYPEHLCRGTVTGSGTLNFYRTGTSSTITGHWFVFEARNDQFNVEHFSDSGTGAFAFVLNEPCDPLKTFSICSFAGGYNTNAYPGRAIYKAYLRNRGDIFCTKYSLNNTSYVTAQVLKFNDTKIHILQEVSEIELVTTSGTVTYNWSDPRRMAIPATLEKSMVIKSFPYFDYTGNDSSSSTIISNFVSTVKFNSEYEIRFDREASGYPSRPSFYVIDWDGYTVSGTTNPNPIDPEISFVKSVQNSRIVLSERQGMTPLTKDQDINNCVVFSSQYQDGTSTYLYNSLHDIYLSDTNTVCARRCGTNSSGIIDVSVVEFYPDQVKVQSGVINFNDTTEVSYTLPESIDKDKSFLLAKWSVASSTQIWPAANVRCRVIDNNTLGFYRNYSSGRINLSWFLAEDITENNNCFDVHHWEETSTADVSEMVAEEHFPYHNIFLISSAAGGYTGNNYGYRSCFRSFYSFPNKPQYIDVYSPSSTLYYSGQVVRIRRGNKFYTYDWTPTFDTGVLTSSLELTTAWSGCSDITVYNNTMPSFSRINYSSQDYNAAAFYSIRIIDYDDLSVQAETGYSPVGAWPSFNFICWPGTEIYNYDYSIPTKSLIRSIEKITYTGTDKGKTWFLTKKQNANNCIPLVTWNCLVSVGSLNRLFKYFCFENMFGSPHSLHMQGGYSPDEEYSVSLNAYIVEFDDKQVKVQQGTIGTDSTDFTVTIEEVNLEKAFLVFYSFVDSTNSIWPSTTIGGTFEDSSTLRFRRVSSAGVYLYVSWFVVECLQDQWRVQHLYSNPESSGATLYNTLEYRVDINRTWIFNSFSGGYNDYTYASYSSFAALIRTDNLIAIGKSGGSYTTYHFCSEVVEFNSNVGIRILWEDPSSSESDVTYDTITTLPSLEESRTIVFNPMINNLNKLSGATSQTNSIQEVFVLHDLIDFDISDPKLQVLKGTAVYTTTSCSCITEFPNYNKYYFEGYAYEEGYPVSREIALYRTDTDTLMDMATSESGTGYFYVETTYSGEHHVVCFDDVPGTNYNHLIYGKVYPTVISGCFAYNEGLTASGIEVGVPSYLI